MAEAFKKYPDLEITWLLSGREQHKGCGDIKDFLWREGITFIVKAGKINIVETLGHFNFRQFRQDVNELDLKAYDLVISDFEPVICHAAKKQNMDTIGIGHQYAFDYKIPMKGANIISKSIMNKFAPVTKGVGLHWHHFGYPILPPIIDLEMPANLPAVIRNKVLVYLPFESTENILSIFREIRGFQFFIYHPELTDEDQGHIHTRNISRINFKKDLLDARSVISNSGFELISECLQIGKSILVKPLLGQMEQLSNAQALKELKYASTIDHLDPAAIKSWLNQDNEIVQVSYPDVASTLAEWISNGCEKHVTELAEELWQEPFLSQHSKAS